MYHLLNSTNRPAHGESLLEGRVPTTTRPRRAPDFEAARIRIVGLVAAALKKSPDEVDLTASFVELGLDSLEVVDLLATIESLLGREVAEEQVKGVTRLEEVLDLVKRELGSDGHRSTGAPRR